MSLGTEYTIRNAVRHNPLVTIVGILCLALLLVTLAQWLLPPSTQTASVPPSGDVGIPLQKTPLQNSSPALPAPGLTDSSRPQHPRIDWVLCWFDVPEDWQVDCGEWRAQLRPDDDSFQALMTATEFVLRFVRLRDNSADHRADPLVYISGGPGNSSYLEADNMETWFYWAEIAGLSRDLVFVDQRGTGLSIPLYQCRNYSNYLRETLRQDLDVKTEFQRSYDAMVDCIETARQRGFTFSDYSTTLSMEDMNQLLVALDYPQWNLLGGSYGTRLALDWMRHHPDRIRATILDSAYPMDKGSLLDWPQTLHESFDWFWQQCPRVDYCGKSARTIADDFWQAVNSLDAHPQTITVSHWYGDWPLTAVINGQRFITMTYQALYDDTLQDDIVRAIDEVNRVSANIETAFFFGGSDSAFRKLAEHSINGELAPEFNPLTYFAIECAENPMVDSAAYEEKRAAYPDWLGYTDYYPEYDICNLIPVREDIDNFRTPVETDIPTLILSGGYDPVTPPRWARELAERLPRGNHWHFPQLGHGVTGSSACVHQSLRQFLDHPGNAPQPRCEP